MLLDLNQILSKYCQSSSELKCVKVRLFHLCMLCCMHCNLILVLVSLLANSIVFQYDSARYRHK